MNCRAQCIAVDSAVFSSADLFPWGFARLCFEEEVTETPGDRGKNIILFFRLCQMLKKNFFCFLFLVLLDLLIIFFSLFFFLTLWVFIFFEILRFFLVFIGLLDFLDNIFVFKINKVTSVCY